MKISAALKQQPRNFKGNIYTSAAIKKAAGFAQDNSALFCAGVTLALSSIARPAAILLTPKTDEENKKIAASKSIASSLTGFLLTAMVSTPFASAVKNIDSNPEKFLKEQTIKNLKGQNKTLASSRQYQFMTQLFKLGLGLLIAIPKSQFTSFLIPKIMKFFPEKKEEKKKENISFKGNLEVEAQNKLSKALSAVINQKPLQKAAYKLQNTNFEQGFMFLSDFALTAAFVHKTQKNDKIEEKRKKPLIYNSILSTLFSTISSFSVNKLIDIKFQKFIDEFKKQNSNLPCRELEKYISGLNIAKLALISGGIYYIIIPIISTFLSDKISDNINSGQNKNAKTTGLLNKNH